MPPRLKFQAKCREALMGALDDSLFKSDSSLNIILLDLGKTTLAGCKFKTSGFRDKIFLLYPAVVGCKNSMSHFQPFGIIAYSNLNGI